MLSSDSTYIHYTQSYLPQLYEQYETAMKENIITYSMKSSFIEGFVILKYVHMPLLDYAYIVLGVILYLCKP